MKSHFFLLIVMASVGFSFMSKPVVVEAGWLDKAKRSVNNTTRRAQKSYTKKKESYRNSYQRKKKQYSDSYQRKKKQYGASYQRKKKQYSDSYQRKKKQYGASYQRKKKQYSDSYQRKKKQYGTSYQRKKKQYSTTYERKKKQYSDSYRRNQEKIKKLSSRTKQYGIDASNRLRVATSNYGAAASQRLGNAYRTYSSKSLENISRAKKLYGQKGHDLIDETIMRHGSMVGNKLAHIMAKSKKGGVDIINRAKRNMDVVGEKISDPNFRQKAMAGVISATAVAYYAHTHRDDIEYKAIKYGMENIQVPVYGQSKPIGNIITDAILKRAPQLSGTDFAEDPAAVLAYGATTVGKNDLMEHIDIIPDGRGGLRSINETIDNTAGAEDAVQALQFSSTFEGMAMNAAENGQLGQHGTNFAASYTKMEQTFGE